MPNRKLDNIKKLIEEDASPSIRFGDLLVLTNACELLCDLIYIVGYNYIEVERFSATSLVFRAGMFHNELTDKLILKDGCLEGGLSLAVMTVFNVLCDTKKLSKMLDLYPPEVRRDYIDDVIKKNGIDYSFWNNIQSRVAS